LDPIDGTKGFLRGAHYAVALAFLVEGEVKFGVVGCPHLGLGPTLTKGGPGFLFIGARGMGSWSCSMGEGGTFNRIQVSSQSNPIEAQLLGSVEAAHTDHGRVAQLAKDLQLQKNILGMDSLAKYAVVASGEGDVLVRFVSRNRPNYSEWIWDHAAGVVIVEEAGGCVTDLSGKTLDFHCGKKLSNNRGVVVSNGHLHKVTIDTISGFELNHQR